MKIKTAIIDDNNFLIKSVRSLTTYPFFLLQITDFNVWRNWVKMPGRT